MNPVNKKIYIPIFFFISLFASVLPSCKKFVEISTPPDKVLPAQVFSDSTSAKATVAGLYISMLSNNVFNFYNGGITVYTGLSADELLSNNSTNTDEQGFFNNAISSTSATNNTLWSNAYQLIYQINAILEGLSTTDALSSSLKNQLTGESKFLRAFVYFYLTNLYGDVPLVTTTSYLTNQSLSRTATSEVYLQITSDLLDAQALLSTTYPTSGRVRANKWAATALLARVYLYQSKWSDAEAASTSVISSGMYSLVSPLTSVFLSGSNEAIYQFLPIVSGANTIEGLRFIPSSSGAVPTYPVTTSLLNFFETGDNRKSTWLGSNTIGTTTYYYPYKYRVRTGSTITENYMVLRLAEQYLIRAESKAQQGTDLSGAIADLNIIRNRAGLLPLSTSLTQSQVKAAVAQERRAELFVEWGHRWFDLKRTGAINTVLGGSPPVKPNWNSNAALFPIPSAQILLNSALTQNPGY